ncbi:AT hook-like [Macleaya cordata]|uniref:AT hook-like n=1 Tax=Macleaya cordata TaxID=56857 RepID=A0A200R0K1_MACCD|nr:AT hook-like [Macleaya cordata]
MNNYTEEVSNFLSWQLDVYDGKASVEGVLFHHSPYPEPYFGPVADPLKPEAVLCQPQLDPTCAELSHCYHLVGQSRPYSTELVLTCSGFQFSGVGSEEPKAKSPAAKKTTKNNSAKASNSKKRNKSNDSSESEEEENESDDDSEDGSEDENGHIEEKRQRGRGRGRGAKKPAVEKSTGRGRGRPPAAEGKKTSQRGRGTGGKRGRPRKS